MQADISAFEQLQTTADPSSESIPGGNAPVWQGEGIKLIRQPVRWEVNQDNGRFNVFELDGDTTAHWEASFSELEEAKLFIEGRKIRLQQ